ARSVMVVSIRIRSRSFWMREVATVVVLRPALATSVWTRIGPTEVGLRKWAVVVRGSGCADTCCTAASINPMAKPPLGTSPMVQRWSRNPPKVVSSRRSREVSRSKMWTGMAGKATWPISRFSLGRNCGENQRMNSKVVVAEKIAEAGIETLRESCEVVVAVGAERSEVLALLGDAEGLVVRSATDVDAEMIAAAPRLRVIGRAGIGVDNIDVAAATEAGIIVVNAPQAN